MLPHSSFNLFNDHGEGWGAPDTRARLGKAQKQPVEMTEWSDNIPEIRGKPRNRLKLQLVSFTMEKFVLHSV